MGHIIAMAQDAGEIQPTFPKWYKTFTAAMSNDGKGKSHQDGYDRLNAWKLAGRFDELLTWYEGLNDKPKVPHASNSPAKFVLWLAKTYHQNHLTDEEIEAEEKAKAEEKKGKPATAKVLKERLTALVKTVLADDHAKARQLALLVEQELNGTTVKAPLHSDDTVNGDVLGHYQNLADEVAAELLDSDPSASEPAPPPAESVFDDLPIADVSTKPARAKKAGRKTKKATAVDDPEPNRRPEADRPTSEAIPMLFEETGGAWGSVEKEAHETQAEYEARLRKGWASGQYKDQKAVEAAMAAPLPVPGGGMSKRHQLVGQAIEGPQLRTRLDIPPVDLRSPLIRRIVLEGQECQARIRRFRREGLVAWLEQANRLDIIHNVHNIARDGLREARRGNGIGRQHGLRPASVTPFCGSAVG